MDQLHNFKPKKNTQFFLKSMFFGLTFNLSLYMERPINTTKLILQNTSNSKKLIQASTFKEIYKETNTRRIFKGLTQNMLKLPFKNLFRLPAMIYLPNIFKRYLKTSSPLYFETLPKIFAGIAFSIFEVYFLSPLERIKAFYIGENTNLSKIMKNHKGDMSSSQIKGLFKGLGPAYWLTLSGWQTFILSNHYLKRLWKERLCRKQLSNLDLITISSMVSVLSTITTLPFVYIKSQNELELKSNTNNSNKSNTIVDNDYINNSNNNLKNKGTLRKLLELLSKKKYGLLYSGWKTRIPNIFINTTIGVVLLEKFETDFKILH